MKKMLMMVGILATLMAPAVLAHGGPAYQKGENVFEHLHEGDKKAILLVHFGTTVKDTREKTIDAINDEFRHDFGDFEIREAFTSREIIGKLRAQGIEKDNPMEAMDKLAKEGYTHILVQSTNIINGVETENLTNEVNQYKDRFEVVRVGSPLLTHPENYVEVAEAVAEEIPADKDTAVVMVGHGTHHYAGSAYANLDYVFKAKDMDNYFVGTVEGYPGMKEVEKFLAEGGYKKVIVAPLMFVAGDHAINDIAGDWKEELEEKGYEVEAVVRGLGEYKSIQHIYAHSAEDAMTREAEDIAAKKARLAKK